MRRSSSTFSTPSLASRPTSMILSRVSGESRVGFVGVAFTTCTPRRLQSPLEVGLLVEGTGRSGCAAEADSFSTRVQEYAGQGFLPAGDIRAAGGVGQESHQRAGRGCSPRRIRDHPKGGCLW